MDLGRLKFFILEVCANLTRNAAMQLTAIATVAVSIVLLGTFLFVKETSAHLGAELFNRIEISVFLDDASTDTSAATLRRVMRADRHIATIRYIPKAQGLKEMSQRLHGEIDTSLLTSNPLPNAFRVQVDAPSHVAQVASRLSRLQGVSKVSYAKEIVVKLLRIADVVQGVGLILIIALGCVSAIIISNTIRLTVFARRREIAIMQLVGATNAYIRAPFIMEGLIDGLVGAGLAVGILSAAHAQLLPRLVSALPFLPLGHLAVDEKRIVFELLGVGAAVGATASWLAVGRYLKI